jgi:hypothetical protein
MARPNKKLIREKLALLAQVRGRQSSLLAQREAAIAPLRAKYDRAVAKVEAEFVAQINESDVEICRLEKEIKAEIEKGFDAGINAYSITKVAGDGATVEVVTRSQREIDAQKFFDAVPVAERKAGFWNSISVLVGKAEKFRSDIVAALATEKKTHSIKITLN